MYSGSGRGKYKRKRAGSADNVWETRNTRNHSVSISNSIDNIIIIIIGNLGIHYTNTSVLPNPDDDNLPIDSLSTCLDSRFYGRYSMKVSTYYRGSCVPMGNIATLYIPYRLSTSWSSRSAGVRSRHAFDSLSRFLGSFGFLSENK